MTELSNPRKMFRFQPQIGEVIDEILSLVSPSVYDLVVQEIEPMLLHRDWQVEDAITRALQCQGTSVGDPSATILADSPIGYWKMQDAFGASTFASAGSVSPGAMTINGAPTLQETVAGVTSTRTASGNFGSLADATAWSPQAGANGKISVEAWVYPRAFTANGEIVAKCGPPNSEYEFYVNSSGILTAIVYDPATSTAVMSVVASTAISLNTWTHVAFTYNRTTPLIAVYIDGAVSASNGTASGSSADSTVSLQIAAKAGAGAGRFFTGNLAHVAMFSTELSAARVAAHAAFTP